MAQPALSTYSVSAGQPIHGGRWPGGRLGGSVDLGAAVAAGGMAVPGALAGGATLADAAAGGSMSAGVDAYVQIMGQSNALGVGNRSEITQPPLSSDAGLATFDAGPFDRVMMWTSASPTTFEPLENGYNNAANLASQIGPEFGLAVRWMRETTTGILYIAKSGYSSTTIEQWRDGGSYFDLHQVRHDTSVARLAAVGASIGRRGWLWVQGESNAGSSESAYRTQLDGLHADRQAAGMSPAGERLVLAQMAPSSASYDANVAAAKASFVAAAADRYVITCPAYLNGDAVHYNARGQIQIGYDAFEKIFGAAHLDA